MTHAMVGRNSRRQQHACSRCTPACVCRSSVLTPAPAFQAHPACMWLPLPCWHHHPRPCAPLLQAVAAYQVYCAVQTTNGRDLASGNFAAILPPAPPLPSNVGGSPSNGAASTNVTGTANSAAVAAPLALPLLALLLADLLL